MHRTFAITAAAALLAACSPTGTPPPTLPATASSVPSAPTSSDAQLAVRALVERFGQQMRKVSTLAPPEALRRQLQVVYGDMLSAELLAAWQAHPHEAVGRDISSPWPQRIEISQVDCGPRDTCRVAGEVVYMTSNEMTHGGVFMRRGITLEVGHTEPDWRITSVRLAPVPQ